MIQASSFRREMDQGAIFGWKAPFFCRIEWNAAQKASNYRTSILKINPQVKTGGQHSDKSGAHQVSSAEPEEGRGGAKLKQKPPHRPHLAQMMLMVDSSSVMQRKREAYPSSARPDPNQGTVQRQYAASITFKPPDKANNFKANQLYISKIVLPEGVNERPETSIPGSNEGAHTIS